jgi:hypothetical protein
MPISRWLTPTRAATSALVRIRDSSGTLIVVAFLSRPQMGNRRFASMIKTPEQMRKENEIAFANLRQLLERMRPRDTGKAV